MNREENVAEHTFYVSLYTLTIIEHLREHHAEWFQDSYRDGGLDLYSLLAKALCHDLEERMSGDIVATFKKRGSDIEKLIHEKAFQVSHEVFVREGIPLALQNFCEGAKDPNRIVETAIISLADSMCVASTLIEEFEFAGSLQAQARLSKKFIPYLKRSVSVLETQKIPEPIIGMYKNLIKIIRKRCGVSEVNPHVYIGEQSDQ